MAFPISTDDALAVVYSRQIHSYYMNTTLHARAPRTVEALMEIVDERAICCVLKFEAVSARPTDITEYCARQYLYARDRMGVGIKPQDEHDFPLYVRNSIAWSLWKDDLEAEAAVIGFRGEPPALSSALEHIERRAQRREAANA